MDKLAFQARLKVLSTTISNLKVEKEKILKDLQIWKSNDIPIVELTEEQITGLSPEDKTAYILKRDGYNENKRLISEAETQLQLIDNYLITLTEKRNEIKQKFKRSRSKLVLNQAKVLNDFLTQKTNLSIFDSYSSEILSLRDLPKSFINSYKKKLEDAKIKRKQKRNNRGIFE